MITLKANSENSMASKRHEDHKYIDALLSNDKELIKEIYSKNSALIKSMVLKNNGSVNEAKDIFQDCLIELYKMAQNGFVLSCPLKNFLYLMCKRRWLNELRNSKRKTKSEFTDLLENSLFQEAEEYIEEMDQESLRRNVMLQKLSELGPSCQQIIKLSWSRDVNGKFLKWNEIATKLDLSYGYVRKKAAECKSKLVALVRLDPSFEKLINE